MQFTLAPRLVLTNASDVELELETPDKMPSPQLHALYGKIGIMRVHTFEYLVWFFFTARRMLLALTKEDTMEATRVPGAALEGTHWEQSRVLIRFVNF